MITVTIGDDATISAPIGSIATIIGYQHANPDGFAFYGIPYAQPPIGQNRFSPTQRKDPSGRIFAFHFGSACIQEDQGNFDEDCLFLNIWTPKMNNFTANKYPVLFYIHDGAYVTGTGNLQLEGLLSNLVSRDIIVVSFNYRVGMFGFFSTRDSTVPGNMAILDQIEALKWVQRYIAYFGGDPSAVTIVGESGSGGESVSLLTLSPITKGLFRAAIMQSGSGFSPGIFTYSDVQMDASKQAAIKFGCITAEQWDQHDPASMAQMLQCMRSKSVSELQTAWGGWDGYDLWATVMDDNVLPDHLENLMLKRAPIPVLMGSCNNESLISYVGQLLSDPNFLTQWTRQYVAQEFLGKHFVFRFFNNTDIVRQQAIKTFVDDMPYDDQDHVNWLLDAILIQGEMILTGPTYREAMNFRQIGSPVYLYSFDYLAPGALPSLTGPLRGVMHKWELQYLFGNPATSGGGWPKTSDDDATMNYFGLYWANFVKYGNPTPAPSTITWPRLNTNGEFLSLGPVPTPSNNFHPTAATFWACTATALEGHKPVWCA